MGVKAPNDNVGFFWNLAHAGNAMVGAGIPKERFGIPIKTDPDTVPAYKQEARNRIMAARKLRQGDVKRLPESTEIVAAAMNNEPSKIIDLVNSEMVARISDAIRDKYNPAPVVEPDHSEETN